jgi:hypothetical protein
MKSRFCRVCGQPFRPVRFDALTCSGTCRMRKSRGADLAYLTTLPPDQARARRMIHDAVEFEIATARDVGAAQREGRRARRGMPRVKRMKSTRHSRRAARWALSRASPTSDQSLPGARPVAAPASPCLSIASALWMRVWNPAPSPGTSPCRRAAANRRKRALPAASKRLPDRKN